MFEKLAVQEIMESDVITLRSDMLLSEARDVLIKSKITGAPVTTEGGDIEGVLSLTDLMKVTKDEFGWSAIETGYYRLVPEMSVILEGNDSDVFNTITVSEVMTDHLYTIESKHSVASAAALMRQHNIHRLIVVDGGALTGIVTAMDVLKLVEGH